MILEYITLASCLNFILLAIILLFKKSPNPKSNQILFVLFLFMAAYCALIAFHYSALERKNYSSLLYYTPIDGIFLLSMGPCLYFYVLSVLNKPILVFRTINLLHLVSFIPYLLFCIYFLTLPFQQRIDWLILDFNAGTSEMNWLNGIIYSQTVTYLLLSYKLVNKQLKSTSIIEFEKTQFNIGWLKVYLIINICFITITLPLCFFIANERTSIIIGQLAMDIQFIYMFFKWTLHNDFALIDNHVESSIDNYSESATISNRLTLNDDIISEQLTKLQTYMDEFKPYLNEACNIQKVSEETGIPLYRLSNLLNSQLHNTFPDFINEYRINSAKRILLYKRSETIIIEFIAAECGFGSKSSFNRAFKKFSNNLTPSEFIRQHKSIK